METLGAVKHQMEELRVAGTLESDLDLAFRLQMEEAMTASVSSIPSSSRPRSPPLILPEDNGDGSLRMLQMDEFERFDQEHRDHERTIAEQRKAYGDLQQRLHDKEFARACLEMPDEEWFDDGDYFQRPFQGGEDARDPQFRLFFKGLTSVEHVNGMNVSLSGVGVAICDEDENLLLEVKKPTGFGSSRMVTEARALIEGLEAALELGLQNIIILCDFSPLHKYILGRWSPKQRKVINVIAQVKQLTRKFRICQIQFLSPANLHHVYWFARQAIALQLTKPIGTSEVIESDSAKFLKVNCSICLEDKDAQQMFSVEHCSHLYCFSCMRQHVEAKLHNGTLAKCPHEGCNSTLSPESCKVFLSQQLLDKLIHRMEEAAIPETDKLYCPYPKCSALMSRTELLRVTQVSSCTTILSGLRRCVKCQLPFCVYCKVQWHVGLSCQQYKLKNPYPRAEDAKFQCLANQKLWRQCVKCKHMIELSEGCYHITCRCGYEFCYTCGAEYVRKKATCACPIWDEYNIIRGPAPDLGEEDDDDDDDDDIDDFYDDYDYPRVHYHRVGGL